MKASAQPRSLPRPAEVREAHVGWQWLEGHPVAVHPQDADAALVTCHGQHRPLGGHAEPDPEPAGREGRGVVRVLGEAGLAERGRDVGPRQRGGPPLTIERGPRQRALRRLGCGGRRIRNEYDGGHQRDQRHGSAQGRPPVDPAPPGGRQDGGVRHLGALLPVDGAVVAPPRQVRLGGGLLGVGQGHPAYPLVRAFGPADPAPLREQLEERRTGDLLGGRTVPDDAVHLMGKGWEARRVQVTELLVGPVPAA